MLLSALLFEREREITDALVELLISTVHRIDARAEKKVVKEFVKDFRRVTGKDTLRAGQARDEQTYRDGGPNPSPSGGAGARCRRHPISPPPCGRRGRGRGLPRPFVLSRTALGVLTLRGRTTP